jgi:hypothetical protein
MADSSLIARRLRGLIPYGWFDDAAPIRDAVLGGIADGVQAVRNVLLTAKDGTRRATTTGWLLDIDAFGFLGTNLLRRATETDDSFRSRYIGEINRERGNRRAITQALFDLTGRAPVIVEPWNVGDTGGWDTPILAWSGAQVQSGPIGGYDSPYAGWDVGLWGFDLKATQSQAGSSGVGCWGSLEMPNQVLLTAYRQIPTGPPDLAGWDSAVGGWDVGSFVWSGDGDEVLAVDDEIYAAINRTKAAGVSVWTQILN